MTMDVIEYITDNKWSGSIQDAMIRFIALVIGEKESYETDLLRMIMDEVGTPER